MESPKVIDISIVFKVANKAGEIKDFIDKGLKYAIKQHAQSKWEVDKIRSNVEGEKWKDCKDTALNVGMGIISGVVKCSPLIETPPAMFVCVLKDIASELFRPETLGCIADYNQYNQTTKELGGDIDDSCCIF